MKKINLKEDGKDLQVIAERKKSKRIPAKAVAEKLGLAKKKRSL